MFAFVNLVARPAGFDLGQARKPQKTWAFSPLTGIGYLVMSMIKWELLGTSGIIVAVLITMLASFFGSR